MYMMDGENYCKSLVADGTGGAFMKIHNNLFKNNFITNGGNDGCYI